MKRKRNDNSGLRLYEEGIGGLLRDRSTVHYRLKHGSWLNQAEIEISLFTRDAWGTAGLQRSAI